MRPLQNRVAPVESSSWKVANLEVTLFRDGPMSDSLNYQLELIGDTATLYLLGGVCYRHVAPLLTTCSTIPAHVRTLRVDLHALGQLSAEATGVVRLLLRHWRDTRRGEFRLSTSHMLATLSSVNEAMAAPV